MPGLETMVPKGLSFLRHLCRSRLESLHQELTENKDEIKDGYCIEEQLVVRRYADIRMTYVS